jgi:3-oxoadipate enol-lactonase
MTKGRKMELKPVKLFVEERGQGTPVVLLHGFPLDHTIWAPIVPLLESKARLIMPDLRGYGQSPDKDEIHSMRLLAADIVELMDQLELEKVILCGHSMGGYVALSFAHAYPNRLLGLGLVATQADADTPERRQARLITAREVRSRGVKYIADGMPSKLTKDEAIQKTLHDMIMNIKSNAIISSLKGMAERPDANPWLGAIKKPVVVIAGGEDQLIPGDKAHTITRMVSKSWLVEIPQAGHMPMLEAPAQVAEALHQLICATGGC